MALVSQKVLSEEEYVELEKALHSRGEVQFRNTTFIWALIHTGSRVSEVLGIRSRDLISSGRQVFIRGLKNSNDRELPLPPFLFDRLLQLSKGLGPDERIFSFTYSNAQLIWKHFRPKHKKLHSLRHYRAMEIYRKSKDIRLVQRILGHKSMSTSMIYTEYDYSVNEIRKVLLG